MGVSIFDERDPKIWILSFSGPGNYGAQSITFGAGNGSRVDAITAFNPDSIDHTFLLELAVDGASGYIGTVTVPAGAGVGAVPFKDCLADLTPAQLAGIVFPQGGALILAQGEDIVASVDLNVTFFGGSL